MPCIAGQTGRNEATLADLLLVDNEQKWLGRVGKR